MYQSKTTMTLKGTVYPYKVLNFWNIFPPLEKSLLNHNALSHWIKPWDPTLPPQLMNSSSSRGVIHTLQQGKGQSTAARLSYAFKRIYFLSKNCVIWGSLKFEGMGWGQEKRGKNLDTNREERWCDWFRKCPCPVFYHSLSVTQLQKYCWQALMKIKPDCLSMQR